MHLPTGLWCNTQPIAALLVIALLMGGCGGYDRNATPPSVDWEAGNYDAFGLYANFCANPRTGVHPYTHKAFLDRQGNTAHQNHFLRSWSHTKYLWYKELPDLDPNSYDNSGDYFEKLKTEEKTTNGNIKDRFHFSEDEVIGDQLTYTGEQGGYGVRWKYVNGTRYVAWVEPNTPASQAGIKRGMWLSHVDGVAINGASAAQEEVIKTVADSPPLGTTASFIFVTQAGDDYPVTLISQNVAASAVYSRSVIATATGNVGYLAFNTFNTYTAEDQLKEAFEFFASNTIDDLVIDLRYNNGGFVYIGAQLGFLVAGTQGDDQAAFTVLQYNDKRNNSTKTYRFIKSTRNGQNSPQPLTSVNLNRVYVLTTGNTCSASEGFINGLRGLGIEVIQIGSATCGKPHGFNAISNCGRRYFSIIFETVNAQGFGDYADGFSPVDDGTDNPLNHKVNGCTVGDDLTRELGDKNEAMLQTALFHRANNQCPPTAAGYIRSALKNNQPMRFDGQLITPLSSTIMRDE